ncbi:MAG: Holliday junction resolvase RuvX [Acidimicrobiaceae bacterium]|nr:Holliday junction resolvase RuvX [Acidimicrobiaceae bacterium]
MRLLGIDPGTRRCGVAVTDTAQSMAFPREALENDDTMFEQLAQLIDQESIERIVIGRPVALSGNVTRSTEIAHELFEAIVVRFPAVVVEQWDERFTTREAQRSLSGAGLRARDQRSRIDSAAAVIMLQNYIDAQRPH